MNEKKRFIVSAKCGHVGRNNYIVIDFVVQASNAKEAAKIARSIPRVKHHWKDAIECVRQVSLEAFNQQILINQQDDYLKAQSIQDQKRMCKDIAHRVHQRKVRRHDPEVWAQRQERVRYQMKKIKVLEKLSWVS